ncbi:MULTISPECIES: histidine kinase dimerization/phospho-acceptor domain-containing protein [Hahella]|uniref:histidine kinase n=1 Tax=Hahella chejuensis (strain KCTC 2396) TaxID=349521 RepID=Q2SCK5_HAHCH|nr:MULTISPECIES: histidine kinase dimerization/phospho-acceptor domain-containing protein [Hahella]ABC31619.1 probable sensor protein/histidine kinase containing His Kinase A domain [Hahella chejuensis KCTC 2396]AZZ91190.1 histidine kinase [Hahella sp. KA22]MBU6952372.1 histidine kinase [Hahella sp. HN01]QAY54558.1 histidine kinase [Hahella sp. KA22]
MTQEADIAKLAHDLRNPLNSISVNAELAKLQLQTNRDKEEILVCVERILEECKRCSARINDLVNASATDADNA